MLEWDFKLLEHQANLTEQEHCSESDIEKLKIIKRLLTHPDTLKILEHLLKYSKSFPAPKRLKQKISFEDIKQAEKIAEEKNKQYWDASEKLMDAEDKAMKSGDFLLAESIEDKLWKLSHDNQNNLSFSPYPRGLSKVDRLGYLVWDLYIKSSQAWYNTQDLTSSPP